MNIHVTPGLCFYVSFPNYSQIPDINIWIKIWVSAETDFIVTGQWVKYDFPLQFRGHLQTAKLLFMYKKSPWKIRISQWCFFAEKNSSDFASIWNLLVLGINDFSSEVQKLLTAQPRDY